MKIVIAPDSFKESVTAEKVAEYVQEGFQQVFPRAEYCRVPMADGGEGSLEAIKATLSADEIKIVVKDAYFRDNNSSYLLDRESNTALIEIARICGIELTTAEERNPAVATTFGVGQAISDALDKGAKKIVLFIGGSATNDGGAGLYQALGGKLLDKSDRLLDLGCSDLFNLSRIDNSGFDSRIADTAIEVACDVTNKLLGQYGATYVFGPQKGVLPEQLEVFDHCLRTLAEFIESDLHKNVFDLVGGGAAGGLGAGLYAFCGAQLRSGFDIISDVVNLTALIADADLVITGEGRIDSQSAQGKVPCGVANIAAKHGVPVIGIAGSLSNDTDEVYKQGISALFSITNTPMLLQDAMRKSRENIIATAKNIALLIHTSPQIKEINTHKYEKAISEIA